MNIKMEIEKLGPWFHNLHLPDGNRTAPDHPLGDFPTFKWKEIESHIPLDLTGMTAIDIGCNAGFYSFELTKRGARVTAIDIDQHYLDQAQWAAEVYGFQDKIKFEKKQIYDLASKNEKYDIVWYMGVFYHLRYPFLSLDIVSRITGKLLVFQTMTIPDSEEYPDRENLDLSERKLMGQAGWPKMAFIEHSIAGDPTNWWSPNHTAVEAMLRASGFNVLKRPAHEIYICEPDGEIMEEDDLRMWEFRSATGLNR